MLEGHEPSRRRYLADKDKAVVQQYMSEKTFMGKPDPKDDASTKSSGGGAAAAVGGVVVLGALGTVGYLAYAKKACFSPKAPAPA